VRIHEPRFFHVVFADTRPPSARSLNLAAAPATAAAESRESGHLGGDDDTFIAWVLARGGLDPEQYRVEPLRRRVPACLRALRVGSTRAARAVVADSPAHLRVAVSALILGVTGFFRDEVAFAALGDAVETLRRRAPCSIFRVWSAGCSDGAELYSIAIALAERGMLHSAQLLGTDCRADAIAHARAGCYDDDAVCTVPAALRARYFQRRAAVWEVVEPIRRAITWRVGDVLALHEPGPWDLIACRNLSIYLRDRAAHDLWRHLESGLRPGGALMVGKAERPFDTALRMFAPCFYRRDVIA
jgi:chemotaxis protein methyltransferase CheR